jgi:hypothetical protein
MKTLCKKFCLEEFQMVEAEFNAFRIGRLQSSVTNGLGTEEPDERHEKESF